MSVPYIEISKYDATRVVYLSEKQAKQQKLLNQKQNAVAFDKQLEDEDFLNDLGMPIFD